MNSTIEPNLLGIKLSSWKEKVGIKQIQKKKKKKKTKSGKNVANLSESEEDGLDKEERVGPCYPSSRWHSNGREYWSVARLIYCTAWLYYTSLLV